MKNCTFAQNWFCSNDVLMTRDNSMKMNRGMIVAITYKGLRSEYSAYRIIL